MDVLVLDGSTLRGGAHGWFAVVLLVVVPRQFPLVLVMSEPLRVGTSHGVARCIPLRGLR